MIFLRVGLRKLRRLKRNRLLGILLALCGIYYISNFFIAPRYSFLNSDIHSECLLPDLNPWDESIKQFDWTPQPIQCDSSPQVVFIDTNGQLQLNTTAIEHHKLSKLSCTYTEIHRAENSDEDVTFDNENPLTQPTVLKSDFVHVKCKDKISYFQYNRVLLHANKVGKSVLKETDDQHSVFMFGVDAVSRLAGIRKLPLTYKFLKENLRAFEFKGHMKTGDNSFPNFISMLTGKVPFSSELPALSEHFDRYPFVWTNFSELSYATYFSEDSPEMNTFNLGKPGFKKQPTDHYMRPFWRAIKKTDLLSTLLDDAFIALEGNKINFRQKSSLCYGNTPKHMLTIQYFKDFVQKYEKMRRFAFSWLNDLSHNYVNFLQLGDQDFKDFFVWLEEHQHLENAFLFFLSDHGSRIDAIRNTYVGRIEERMPMLLIVPPKSLRRKSPQIMENLKENTERLTSHYDIYKTLIDILNKNVLSKKSSFTSGTSLLSQVSKHRSCEDALVPEQYCSCYKSESISIENPVIQQLSNYVIDQINLLLSPDRDKCAHLTIKQIKDASRISLGLKHTGDAEFFTIWKYFMKPEEEKELRYLILLETTPGGGLFEAIVKTEIGGQVSLLGPPSRTNKYGNQSACITDHVRRNFCYCNNM